MSTLNRELVFLILQFFNEEGFTEAARRLETDSGFYFDMKFFEEMILNGNWFEAEKYLSGFTKFDDNRYSTKIYFEIRKQKFLEALDKNERSKALDILMNDLKVFVPTNKEVFMEMTQLLTLNNIREHDSLSMYGDTEFARKLLMLELKKIIEANPLFRDKLKFPSIQSQRLRRLINQGLNWQHIQCTHPQPNPNISSLFVDHVCQPQEDCLCFASSDINPLPSQDTSMAAVSSASLKSTASTVDDSEISSAAFCSGGTTDLEDTNIVSGKLCSENSDEETSVATHLVQGILGVPAHPFQRIFNLPDDLLNSPLKKDTFDTCGEKKNADLPKTVARILNVGSSATSMDFHPVQQTLLLVGNDMGDIGLWEVRSGERLLSRNFNVWDIEACSMKFKATMLKDPCISVKRIAWSPEGSLFGAAYSKHLVQIYSYVGVDAVWQQVEIDAHVGGVNDLSFCIPEDKLLALTCGDDKKIKAWDAITGISMYSFEGHDAPVYAICPYSKEGISFIFSTSVDGNIKAWLYDKLGAIVDYEAPGLGCTSLAYSGGGDRRLFSCGSSKCGESFLVEWDESEGAIKRIYEGLQKNSLAVMQFDIMKNQFLAAGDEHVIKIWDMDKVKLFTTIDADGGLPANPCIRFNKDGTLLAVFANENRIKILATDYGFQLRCKTENCPFDASSVLSNTFRKLAIDTTSSVACTGVADEAPMNLVLNGDSRSLEAVKCEFSGEVDRKLFEINKPTQCRTLWLPSSVKGNKILNLVYNNAGNSILALASNATHLLWKWPVDDKVTTEVYPEFWQPKSCPGLMTNDLTGTNHEEAHPCFALSKNDSYLLSASGGKLLLFNMLTFKKMLSIMSPPPVATSLAFLPQDNNTVAIGRDDSTIVIYNIRLSKVISTLVGHSHRISGLAFSKALNILVSSGADAQIMIWNVQGWEKCASRYFQIPDKKKPEAFLDTCIQFHQDQTHFIAVQETCLAIFEAEHLDCLKQWIPVNFAPICNATFSCDGEVVYASFIDGSVCIFDAVHLELQCRIISTAYHPPHLRKDVCPLVIAAHPQKPNQFAMGLPTGGVAVFEPLNRAGKWSDSPPEDGPASTI